MENQNYTYYKEYTSHKNPNQRFIVRSMTSSDIGEVIDLIVEVDTACHPVAIHLSGPKDATKEFVRSMISPIQCQDLCVVAVDKQTNKIVGCLNAYDQAIPPPPPLFSNKIQDPIPKFDEIGEVLSKIPIKYPEYYQIKEVRKVAHLMALNVHLDYQRCGLATMLAKIVIDHPKLIEFPILHLDAASYFSQIIFKKLGFEVIYEMEYEKMETSKGERPFRDHKQKLRDKGLSEEHTHFSFCVLDRSKEKSSQ